MASVSTRDGVSLHVEEAGHGAPVLFVHEFAGDHRSWEPQLRHFARRYRCVTYAARGYPPSDVPSDPGAYSQDHAVADAIAVLDGRGIQQAHVVGLSMGGFCALHLARLHPERCRSAVVAATGYGAPPEKNAAFRDECDAIAEQIESDGMAAFAARYALGPARVQLQNKDPRGHADFAERLAEHDPVGAASTMRGFQRQRPSLYVFADEFTATPVPVLIVSGDEDEGCLEPSLWLKRTMPTAGLAVLPASGHTLNLEEPCRFNALVADFLATVDASRWPVRDPRSRSASTTGMVR